MFVRECVNVVWTWLQLCPWVLAKLGKDRHPPLSLFYFSWEQQTLSGHVLCGWWTFPSWCLLRGTALGVWDHFRLLDVPLCYCASEIMWPCIFHAHCFHINASVYLHRSLQRGKVNFWNTCTCWRKIQPDLFLFLSYLFFFQLYWNSFNSLLSVQYLSF